MERRTLLPLIGFALVSAMRRRTAAHAADAPSPRRRDGKAILAAAPIEVGGDWGGSRPQAAGGVVSRLWDARLPGVPPVSSPPPPRNPTHHHSHHPPPLRLI